MSLDLHLFGHQPLPALLWPVEGEACSNAAFQRAFALGAACAATLAGWWDGPHLARLPTSTGQLHICRVQLSTLPGSARLAVIEDVQDYHRDVLTGLDDRRALLLDCSAALTGSWAATCAGSWNGGTLALLDIDRFKEVNDTLGHAAGDDVLCALAGLLNTTARYWQGRAYRLGGDEFVLVVPQTVGEEGLWPLQAHFQRLLRQLGIRSSGFSFGLAQAPQHGRTLPELLRHADTLLGERKRTRRGGLVAQLGRAMHELEALESPSGNPHPGSQWTGQ